MSIVMKTTFLLQLSATRVSNLAPCTCCNLFKEEYEYEVYDEDAMLDQGQRLVGAKSVNSDDYPFAVAWTPNFRGRFIFFNLIIDL